MCYIYYTLYRDFICADYVSINYLMLYLQINLLLNYLIYTVNLLCVLNGVFGTVHYLVVVVVIVVVLERYDL